MLQSTLRINPELTFRQIAAADPMTKSRAMIDAAFEQWLGDRLGAPSHTTSPIETMRSAVRFPAQSTFVNPNTKTIIKKSQDTLGRFTSAFRKEENPLNTFGLGWDVEIIPPLTDSYCVKFVNDKHRCWPKPSRATRDYHLGTGTSESK